MTIQHQITKGKIIFKKGEIVRVKPLCEHPFIGEITDIDCNTIRINRNGEFYYNYSIKQIFKCTSTTPDGTN